MSEMSLSDLIALLDYLKGKGLSSTSQEDNLKRRLREEIEKRIKILILDPYES